MAQGYGLARKMLPLRKNCLEKNDPVVCYAGFARMIPEESTPSLLTRRGALRLLALTGAGLAAGTTSSHAFWDFLSGFDAGSPETLRDLRIPAAWMSDLGSQLPSYAAFLRRMNLRHVTVKQVIEPHTRKRGTVQNSLPPRSMWPNIRSTLRVVDSLAQRLELPVKEVVSAYRSPRYNAKCPGAKSSSYHLRNNATDLTFSCPPGKVAAMARAMRSTGLFKGGVGRYGGFTHIDTRGANADW